MWVGVYVIIRLGVDGCICHNMTVCCWVWVGVGRCIYHNMAGFG